MAKEIMIEKAITRLMAAVPQSQTWARVQGEAYGPKNIVPGTIVRKVLYAVTITPAVEDFFSEGCFDLLVAHHPFRPRRPIPNVIFHTALDCCGGGLNDFWRKALGIEDLHHIVDNLGWYGRIRPTPFRALCDRVREIAGGIDGQIRSNKETIESVAICTGLGGWIANEAAATAADVFIAGELTQSAETLAFPAVIEMGHTRSERFGVETIRGILGPSVEVESAPLEIDRFSGEVFRPARNAA